MHLQFHLLPGLTSNQTVHAPNPMHCARVYTMEALTGGDAGGHGLPSAEVMNKSRPLQPPGGAHTPLTRDPPSAPHFDGINMRLNQGCNRREGTPVAAPEAIS